jgi:hypothetical protein
LNRRERRARGIRGNGKRSRARKRDGFRGLTVDLDHAVREQEAAFERARNYAQDLLLACAHEPGADPQEMAIATGYLQPDESSGLSPALARMFRPRFFAAHYRGEQVGPTQIAGVRPGGP